MDGMTHHPHKGKDIRPNRARRQPPAKRSGAHRPGPLVRSDLKEIELTLTPLPDHLGFAAGAVREALVRLGRVGRRLGLRKDLPSTSPRRRQR